ncbi:glycosyltransferase family 2 protein [Endozoicomonas euniceicola]|uniref:Glycosyltransferase family 2 protein n=1 Tax=Endozoicomonas euniceicola TaxID=1234143 RepID=A0ABY6H0D4_9GAMM|nr:glycosyltransferase family 2 protein [Endozoicomonas euniceicola]UYM18515.1 glycosyltransferase family 2 protein [Endozoicomonas euniceicola]
MIVMPMAGLSSRFTKAGYDKPKYMLEAKGKTLFQHATESFSNYFSTEEFLFIALPVKETEQFIRDECEKLGIKNYQIVTLDHPTRGQAETVYLGLKKAQVKMDESLIIFNIDTFRPGFTMPVFSNQSSVDGYLETFIGAGKNWSNVVPVESGSDKVKLTAEKQELSEYCCTGLYAWSKALDFCQIFEEMSSASPETLDGGEYYIAPMYNHLIRNGGDVRFTITEEENVIFCGIPEEYLTFLKV